MPLELSTDDGDLILTASGMTRVWLAHKTIRIPLSAIRSAQVMSVDEVPMPEVKVHGERLGDHHAAGRFSGDGLRQLWNVETSGQVLVVDLSGDSLDRLVLQVDDPQPWADRLSNPVS
ncbi:MAG: hypothetical protein KDC39_07050 [Actinobacteria bacterium]|nr:hypothetical protein [Actinomycetota bacterium]